MTGWVKCVHFFRVIQWGDTSLPFGMLKLASTNMQVHTRQTVYGSSSFSDFPVVCVDLWGYIRTLLYVFLFGLFLLLISPNSSLAEETLTFSNFPQQLTLMLSLDGGGDGYAVDIQCSSYKRTRDTICDFSLHNSQHIFLTLEGVFRPDGQGYARVQTYSALEEVQLSGRSGAAFSLLRAAIPKLKNQWLDLGDGTFFDKREWGQIRSHVLGELFACIVKREDLCVYSHDTQLMIRSVVVARGVELAGSDEHVKAKLGVLDSVLDEGIRLMYKNGQVQASIGEYIRFSIEQGSNSDVSPRTLNLKRSIPLGSAIDDALGSLL